MTHLQVFDFGGRTVRTAGNHDAPLFCAADVCAVLGLDNVGKALDRLDSDEQENITTSDVLGKNRRIVFVTESGLFSLILGSRKPEAKAFRKWVTGEVLPEIRKRGFYDLLAAQQRKQTALLLQEIFPNLPTRAKPIFSELIASLLQLRGESGASANPPWARVLARMVYAWAIPVPGEQHFRRGKNIAPNGSRVDYSMLNDIALERVKHVAECGARTTKISGTWDDWKTKMEIMFGTKAIQLPILMPMLVSRKGGK